MLASRPRGSAGAGVGVGVGVGVRSQSYAALLWLTDQISDGSLPVYKDKTL